MIIIVRSKLSLLFGFHSTCFDLSVCVLTCSWIGSVLLVKLRYCICYVVLFYCSVFVLGRFS